MAKGADTAVGAILGIPPQVLNAIKDAERAIKSLQATSETAARKIKGHFDNTAVSGLNTFIKKIQEAQGKLGNIKMPTIDGTGLASGISQIAQAIATVDKSATAGANRLSRIADSMAKLAASQPSAQMFQEIANGITAIGNTSQQTIANVSLLAQTMAQLARDIRTVQNAQRAQANDTASVAQYNKLYKEQADLVRQKNHLEARGNDITAQEKQQLDAIKKRYDEINDQLTKLNAKKQTAASNLARTAGEVRLTRIETPQGAMDYAKNAKSLRELQDAYKNLGVVMKSVDPRSKDWAQMNRVYQETKGRIDEIRKSMGELQNQTRRTSDMMGQLKNYILGAFSIQAISGFIKKMVEVRGQFELQQVALRAILQDKSEADRIFQQVQQMALQSPFSIMQMTTFTKQLSAYRIESEKLVGTTKMLADVSAGLGVDMGRLILAYGQVKSANYLRACLGRGTEIKTMRGIVKVEDIAVGDRLFNDHNDVTTVAELYNGTQQMYRFSEVASDGYSYRVNEAHILTMYDKLSNAIVDVRVLEYLKAPDRYMGVRWIEGEIHTYAVKAEKDKVDEYFGFKLDGNKRFQLVDGTITHNTEVRQFTEAGLNIAGELANYFSELQGKMVSVGDVMEMITKRMVRFEDVEEVFKRVTSAGGLFYDMQKKQANTISGQLQRITDAISMMYNDIGKSNQSAITSALDMIRELVSHWRLLVPTIIAAGGAFSAFIATKGIFAMIASVKRLRDSIAAVAVSWKLVADAQKAASIANWATGIGAVVSAVALLGAAMYGAAMEANKLNEELGHIETEGVDDMLKLVVRYKELANAAKDTTKTYDEHRQVMEEMKRTYGDILPDYMLELDYLKKAKDGYDDATKSIQAYYAEKIKQQKIEAINKDFADDLQDAVAAASQSFSVAVSLMMKKDIPTLQEIPDSVIKGAVSNILSTLVEEVKSGEKTAQEANNEFRKLFLNAFNISEQDLQRLSLDSRQKIESHMSDIFGRSLKGLTGEYDTVFDVLDKISEKIGGITSIGLRGVTRLTEAAKPMVDEYNNVNETINELSTAFDNLNKASQPQGETGVIDMTAYAQARVDVENLMAAIVRYIPENERAKYSIEEIGNALQSSTGKAEMFGNVQRAVISGLLDSLEKQARAQKNTYMLGQIENWRNKMRQSYNVVTDAVYDYMNAIAEQQNVPLSVFDGLKMNSQSTRSSIVEDIKKIIKAKQEEIEAYKKAQEAAGLYGMVSRFANALGFGKSLDELEQELNASVALLNALGGSLEKSTKKSGKGTDPWQKRLQLFKEINTEYEKLLQYYSEEEAKQKINESYAKAIAEIYKGQGKFAKIDNWIGFDKESMIKMGEEMLSTLKISPEKRKELEKELASLRATVDIDIRKEAIDNMKKQMQEVADNFELTETFSKLGVSTDLVFMLGGKPTTLEEYRQYLIDTYGDAYEVEKKYGKEGLKAYEDILRQIEQKEQKSLEERAKNYAKYIGKSYGESAKVMLDYYTKLTQMQKDFAKYEEQIKKDLANPETPQIDKDRLQGILDNLPEQAQRAASNMRTEMNKELAKINLEKVFKSPLFSEMFQTLGHLSNATLDRMLAQIQQIRDASENLNLSQLRRLSQAEEKIMAAKIDNGSLKDAVKYIKEAYELRSKGTTLQKANEAFAVSQEELTRLEQLKDDVGFVLGLKEKSYAIDIDSKSLEIAGERQALSDQQVKLLTDQKYLQESINATTDDAMSKQLKLVEGAKQNVDAYKNAEDATKKLEKELNAAAEVGKEAGELLKSSFDLFGASISEADQEWVDFASNMLSIIVTLGIAFVALGVTINTTAGILGIIAMALSAITGLFSALFGAHDKRLEKQIRDTEKQVENLERAFEKLQKAIDNAFSFKGVVENTDKAIKNKQAQISKQYEIIRLNDEKKKRDQDAIDEARKKIEDLQDEMAELEKQKYEVFGGFGTEENIRSAAQEFADVWADGFMETGDGLDALKDKFDEFALNMLKKQVWGRLADNLITPILTSFDQAFDKDGNMDPEKWANLVNNLKEINLDAFNEQAKQLADALGFKGGKGELILSDLQKGIQNITEPQAAALEAYMNSIRFEVFHHSEQLERLIAAVSMQYGTGENPMVTELKGIRTVLDNIHSTIRGLIETRVGRGDCLRIV